MQFCLLKLNALALVLLFVPSNLAFPLEARAAPPPLTDSLIIAMAPDTSSCAGRTSQCRTASQAASPIAKSFAKYSVTTVGEQAALLATMLFESGNSSFLYSTSQSNPPVAGKGTYNLQSATYNAQYANSLFTASQVQNAQAQGPNGLLSLLNQDDNVSFGSAAWLLTSTTSCSATRQGLAAGSSDGWTAYLTKCLGVNMNDPTSEVSRRNEIWSQCLNVLSTTG